MRLVTQADTAGAESVMSALRGVAEETRKLEQYDPAEDAKKWAEWADAAEGAGDKAGEAGVNINGLNATMNALRSGGVDGLLKQLPKLVTMLGLGGGLAGILGVAVNAVMALWETFKAGDKETAAFKERLADLDKAVTESARRMGQGMREEFGAALAEQQKKLKEFLSEWDTAMGNVSAGYDRLDAQVKDQLEADLAKLEVEKERALAAAETPEERAEIERTYAQTADTMRSTAQMESQELQEFNARQQEEMAREKMAAAEQAAATAQQQIKEGKQAENEARRRLFDGGIDSDQDKVIDDLRRAKFEFQNAQEKGNKPGMQRAIDELTRLGPLADTAKEEKARGVATFDNTNLDELTPRQRQLLESGKAEIAAAKDAQQEGRKNLGLAKKEGADAADAVAAAKEQRAAIDRRGATLSDQDMARRMRQDREAADASASAGGANQPAPDPQLEQAAEASKQAADEVGESAQKLAVATTDSSKQIAGDMRQLTTEISRNLSLIQSTVADVTRAVAAQGQRTEQVAQMAAAALQGVADMRAGNRPFNRR